MGLELLLNEIIEFDTLDKIYDGKTACNEIDNMLELNNAMYNIIFMDIDMPIVGGYEVVKHIRNRLSIE